MDAFSDDERDDAKEIAIGEEEEAAENLPAQHSPEKSEASSIEEVSESNDQERKARNSESSSTDGSVEGHSDLTYPKTNDYYYFYQGRVCHFESLLCISLSQLESLFYNKTIVH